MSVPGAREMDRVVEIERVRLERQPHLLADREFPAHADIQSALCGANSPNGAERAMLPTVYAAGSTKAALLR